VKSYPRWALQRDSKRKAERRKYITRDGGLRGGYPKVRRKGKREKGRKEGPRSNQKRKYSSLRQGLTAWKKGGLKPEYPQKGKRDTSGLLRGTRHFEA